MGQRREWRLHALPLLVVAATLLVLLLSFPPFTLAIIHETRFPYQGVPPPLYIPVNGNYCTPSAPPFGTFTPADEKYIADFIASGEATHDTPAFNWTASVLDNINTLNARKISKPHVVIYGDSAVVGWQTTEYLPKPSIHRYYWNETINKGAKSYALGVTGDQTAHILWRLKNGELPDWLQPNIIVIATGLNDLYNGINTRRAALRLEGLVRYIRSKRPTANIIVHSILPVRDPREIACNISTSAPAAAGDKIGPAPLPAGTLNFAPLRKSFHTNEYIKIIRAAKPDPLTSYVDCSAYWLDKYDRVNSNMWETVEPVKWPHPSYYGFQRWCQCLIPVLSKIAAARKLTTTDTQWPKAPFPADMCFHNLADLTPPSKK